MIYQSTSSSTAFNYLLGSSGVAAAGSSVYVDGGAYSVDATWQIRKNNIIMDFSPTAVLTEVSLANVASPYSGEVGGGQPVLWLYGNGIIITGATIDGNGMNQAPAPTENIPVSGYLAANFNDGIDISGSNCLVQYSTVYNCRCYGILTAYGAVANNSGVINCKVYNCGANGISASPGIETSTNVYIINNEVYNCADAGIDSLGYDIKITGNYVHDIGPAYVPMHGYNDAAWGICIEGGGGTGNGKYLLIAGNTVTNCLGSVGGGGSGIVVEGMGSLSNILISGNTITNSEWCGIRLAAIGSTSNGIIEFNSITSATNGIYLGSGTGNTVFGNTYSGCSTNFHNGGTGTITTQPSIMAVKVTSSPTGVGFVTANGVAGYAGSYSTSPYIFYATVGSSVTLVANAVSGYTFTSWSDGGAQSHTITVSSSYQTYTATYS